MKARLFVAPLLAAALALPYATPAICALARIADPGMADMASQSVPSGNASVVVAGDTPAGPGQCSLGQCGLATVAVVVVAVSELPSFPVVSAPLAAPPAQFAGEVAPPLTPPPQF